MDQPGLQRRVDTVGGHRHDEARALVERPDGVDRAAFVPVEQHKTGDEQDQADQGGDQRPAESTAPACDCGLGEAVIVIRHGLLLDQAPAILVAIPWTGTCPPFLTDLDATVVRDWKPG